MVAERSAELGLISKEFGVSYQDYKALHRHLFQDVYEWAGETRTIDTSKWDMRYARPQFIDSEMEKRFQRIRDDNNLKGLAPEEFSHKAAEHLSEINAIHTFREGNGRTQREFLLVLGEQAGHRIDLERIDPGRWTDARRQGFHGDCKSLQDLIAKSIVDREAEHRRALSRAAREVKAKEALERDNDHEHER